MPITRPTKFELAINLKTAKALGLEVPATLLARADEVKRSALTPRPAVKSQVFKTRRDVERYFGGDTIQCLICERHFKRLHWHLAAKHGLSADDYKKQFGLPWTRGLTSATSLAKSGWTDERKAKARKLARKSRFFELAHLTPRREFAPFLKAEAVERLGVNVTALGEEFDARVRVLAKKGLSIRAVARGRYDRLPALAADLVARQVAVLVSTGGTMTTVAAKAATTKIPIVFTIGGDPVQLGIVASLNRPGGNITGVNIFTSEMSAKRLGLLHEMVPNAALIAVLINPNNPTVETLSKEIPEAARSVAQRIQILTATTERELDAAFKTMTELGAGALLVAADPFFNSRREYIVALAARHAIPAMYEQREFALAGGLMSYGTNLPHGYRQAGLYAGRVLKGEKPENLPVMQSTEFEFVINLNAAKALGIEVPPGLSASADEVIE